MPGSGSSSSNDGGYSSSNDGSSSADTPSGSAPEEPAKPADLGRRRLPKVKNLQSNEERVDEDLRVAKFYEDKGDLNAAYLRLRDAVKYLPNESETHFSLARLAQKLDKRDEAISEYSTYLKLEPDGENIKQARKALVELAKK
jgi:tetratricopeptide (TPR) repeat protein